MTRTFNPYALFISMIFSVTGFAQGPAKPALPADPTYYKDIAPVIQSKCAVCHQPGEAAPFPLLTYEDVAKRASFIHKVVESRYMPPWRADGQYSHFANERTLSDGEISLITTWIDHKMPRGK